MITCTGDIWVEVHPVLKARPPPKKTVSSASAPSLRKTQHSALRKHLPLYLYPFPPSATPFVLCKWRLVTVTAMNNQEWDRLVCSRQPGKANYNKMWPVAMLTALTSVEDHIKQQWVMSPLQLSDKAPSDWVQCTEYWDWDWVQPLSLVLCTRVWETVSKVITFHYSGI